MKYIIANWKMNLNLKNLTDWALEFNNQTKGLEKLRNTKKIILAPSHPYLYLIRDLINFPVHIAAQDASIFEKGAHTGYTGVFQIKDFCGYAVIGHSERNESYEDVIKKRNLCIKFGITPVICFINPEDAKNVYSKNALIVWEDPKNISKKGSYRSEPPDSVSKKINIIKNIVPDSKLLYGGSVNKNNISALAEINELDGVLVGHASNDPKHFADIIKKS